MTEWGTEVGLFSYEPTGQLVVQQDNVNLSFEIWRCGRAPYGCHELSVRRGVTLREWGTHSGVAEDDPVPEVVADGNQGHLVVHGVAANQG